MRQRLLSLCLFGLALFVIGSAVSAAASITASSALRASPWDPAPVLLATSGATIRPFDVEIPVQCTGGDDSTALTEAVTAARGQWVVIASGQTCAGRDITIPNLRIERGGLLKPLTAHTITLSGDFDAGPYQTFTNALAGQGTVSFAGNTSLPTLYPQWWGTNTAPGTTDMTAAAQAALKATAGHGKVFFPAGSYLITATLTLPATNGSYSPLVIDGEGPFLANLINKASAGKPTLLIDRDAVIVKNMGFGGSIGFPNDGIKVYQSHRVYIQGCEIFSNGNAITLQEAHSVFIQNNFGLMSGGSGLRPTGSTWGWTFGATSSFVYVNIPQGGFANHIVIQDNINEGYSYQVYTAGTGYGFSWVITGNQFEGSTNGFKLDNLNDYEISGNYLGEGGTGYTVEMSNCRNGRLGPNYIHFQTFDSKVSTVKLNNVLSTVLMGTINRLYLTGISKGLVAQGTFIGRLQDETSDHAFSIINSVISDVGGIPLGTLNSQIGRATWYSDSTNIVAYPTARLGDQILKVTPTVGGSFGWFCTTASAAGPLVQVTGSGPGPTVLADYADATAYDFRITILTGGVTGTATYKVEWKTAGGGVYADLTNTTTTTELAHLIMRETGRGPIATFSVRWPTSQTYVAADKWTLTAVVPPAWTAIPGR